MNSGSPEKALWENHHCVVARLIWPIAKGPRVYLCKILELGVIWQCQAIGLIGLIITPVHIQAGSIVKHWLPLFIVVRHLRFSIESIEWSCFFWPLADVWKSLFSWEKKSRSWFRGMGADNKNLSIDIDTHTDYTYIHTIQYWLTIQLQLRKKNSIYTILLYASVCNNDHVIGGLRCFKAHCMQPKVCLPRQAQASHWLEETIEENHRRKP